MEPQQGLPQHGRAVEGTRPHVVDGRALAGHDGGRSGHCFSRPRLTRQCLLGCVRANRRGRHAAEPNPNRSHGAISACSAMATDTLEMSSKRRLAIL